MLRGLCYSVISAICFGMIAVLAKLGYGLGLTAPAMLQQRFGFGALLLLAWLLVRRRSLLRPTPRLLAKAALLGCIYLAQSSLFFLALERIPASTTALVFYFYPVAVTLLAVPLLGQRLDRCTLAALALVMAGCGLVFHDAFLKGLSGPGLALALGSMAVFSGYLLLVQVLLRGEEPLRATFYVILCTAIGFTLWNGPGGFWESEPQRLGLGLVLGLVPTALAISLLYLAIEKIGSAWVSIFSTFEPVATLAAAHLLLGEEVALLQLGGAALIIAGIVLPNARLLRLKAGAS